MTAPMGPSGTVFDIGYQRYTGEREGRRRGRLAIMKDGIRAALGFGRNVRSKILPWAFITVLTAIGLIMAMIAGAVDRFLGQGGAERLNLPSHADYYAIASMIVFVFGAVVAPELLCRDRREGVINLYLVRPITGTDYVASRWLAFLIVMLGATWIPQFVLLTGLALGDPQPLGYLKENWLDIPRFLAAGLAMSAFTTTLGMLTAAFTTRRALASVFLVGLFVVTTPFTIGLAQELDGPAGRWISMFNLTNIPVHVNDVIFGEVSEMTESAPARALGATTLVLWYLAWTIIPGVILWWRYRRLSP